MPPPGGLAIASQSGGVGIALIDLARDLGLGVGSFISLGNKADVSGNDLLAAWLEDPRVTAAALYLESFGNAPKFARMARRFAERKPLLAVVGGRSSGGRRAGASHTAAAATSGVGVDALFAQAGVIACRSAEEIAETALLLAGQPLPAGPRLAVVSNAGGLGVLAADEADRSGLGRPRALGRAPRHPRPRTSSAPPAPATRWTPAPAPPPTTWAPSSRPCSTPTRSTPSRWCSSAPASPTPRRSSPPWPRAAATHPDKPLVLVPMGGLDPHPDDLTGITRYRSVTTPSTRSPA